MPGRPDRKDISIYEIYAFRAAPRLRPPPCRLTGRLRRPAGGDPPAEETLTQEQIDAISDKYGLESPAQQTEALTGADWGVSIKESPAAQP